MQRLSVKKISALGLILLGASVVTAAILPTKVKDSKNGVLIPNSDSLGLDNGVVTCNEVTGGNICTANSQTFTTVGADADSFNQNDRQTENDTSQNEQQSVTS